MELRGKVPMRPPPRATVPFSELTEEQRSKLSSATRASAETEEKLYGVVKKAGINLKPGERAKDLAELHRHYVNTWQMIRNNIVTAKKLFDAARADELEIFNKLKDPDCNLLDGPLSPYKIEHAIKVMFHKLGLGYISGAIHSPDGIEVEQDIVEYAKSLWGYISRFTKDDVPEVSDLEKILGQEEKKNK